MDSQQARRDGLTESWTSFLLQEAEHEKLTGDMFDVHVVSRKMLCTCVSKHDTGHVMDLKILI